MATTNLLTIRNLVRNGLNEDTTILLSDVEINSIINDGYKDIAAKAFCIQDVLEKTSARVVSLYGDNVVRVHHVVYTKGLPAVIPQALGHVPLNAANPQYWLHWGDSLIVEPDKDAETLLVYVSKYPSTVLSADTDKPALPVEFHELLSMYAMAFCSLKLRRWGDAAAFYNKYISDMQRRRYEYVMVMPDRRAEREVPEIVTVREADRGE